MQLDFSYVTKELHLSQKLLIPIILKIFEWLSLLVGCLTLFFFFKRRAIKFSTISVANAKKNY